MRIRSIVAFATALAASSLVARADVKLPALFSDHAVLQRDHLIPVWGTATPGERVTVNLVGATATTTADGDGKWHVELPARAEGGPFTLVIGGTNRIELHDVYVGEVWLASGQSNMEFTVSAKAKSFAGTINEDAEIAAANYPTIRMFTVPLATGDSVATDVVADWKVCSPETVPAFSAVAYFFARDVQASLHVPVGIVTSAYGGSPAQAWIRRDAIAAEPTLAPLLAGYDKAKADFASGAATTQADAAVKAWESAAAVAKASGKPAPRKPGLPRDPTKDQHSPSVCWNAMLAPVEPYAVRGVIWYQGEQNWSDATSTYVKLMTTLINDWRARRGEPLPFLQVQLAGWHAPATQPAAISSFANVREGQRLVMMALPNAAMATAFDVGDADNIHPKNKQEVGRRLALAARATVYGEAIEWSGPLLDAATIEGDAIVVRFTHAKGLKTKDGLPPKTFAFLDAAGKGAFADASIVGETIRIRLPAGVAPTEVRYAWADNPTDANLVNGDGLPALPFDAKLSAR